MPAGRPATAEDLLILRDIGPASPGSVSGPIFSASHDGRTLAFRLQRADLATDKVCFGIFALNLRSGNVVQIDQGGQPDLGHPRNNDFADFTPSGLIVDTVPLFSPDDKYLAYLRRDEGTTTVWWKQIASDHLAAKAHISFDVESFAWLSDGSGIVFSGRPALVAAETVIEAEGKVGYHFDDRWMPINANKPLIKEPIETTYQVIDIATGIIREASSSEKALISHGTTSLPSGAITGAAAANGALAWAALVDPSDVNSPTKLNLKTPIGKSAATCAENDCQHVTGAWWSDDGKILYFMNREGWAKSQLALYRWPIGEAKPAQIFRTDDIFLGCRMVSDELICGHETANSPRRIVKINLKTGELATVFDPNPEYASILPGSVQRLHWTNAFGVPGFGDLVLPPNHHEGQIHPLVVVQYQTRGFLRGGTGDAFPIQVLAAHGIAVLSVEKPADVGISKGGKDWMEIARLDRKDWVDRKSIEASIEAGISQANALGVIDMTRLGISGLSDGASGTQFAIVNSKLFKAAAIATCCEDPSVIEFLDGQDVGQLLHRVGYPTLASPDAKFWSGMSFRQDANLVTTPLLMQLSDHEYMGALEGYAALKAQDRQVDMYVFPDEYHILWHPQHRLAAYERAVDWFDFWLQSKEDPDPAKAEQYKRWEAMRAASQAANH